MSPGHALLQSYHKDHISYIRQLSLSDRRILNNGHAVRLFGGGEYITQLPRKLFLAATTNPLFIDDRSEIRLPPDTRREAIVSIGFYLLALTISPKPFKLRSKNNLEEDLRILKAAWKLCNRLVDAADIQVVLKVVLKVALESEDPFVRLVGEKIAGIIRDGTANGVEKLKDYVVGQPYLKSIVAREDKRHYAVMASQGNKAKRIARREGITESEAQLSQAFVADKDVSGSVKRNTLVKNVEHIKMARKDSAKWEERRTEEAELGSSLQEKTRVGKKVAVLRLVTMSG
ncbi:hypothetical protein DPSP01_012442 [Paraphaeosphaeria sporulosa]